MPFTVRTSEDMRRAGGVKETRREGRRVALLEVVRRMEDKGYSMSDIIELTGISADEINAI